MCTNLDVSKVREYQQGALSMFSSKCYEIPELHDRTAKIFSGIRNFIPKSNESLLNVKPLDKNVNELGSIIKTLENAQKGDSFYKIISIFETLSGSAFVLVAVAAGVTMAVMFSAGAVPTFSCIAGYSYIFGTGLILVGDGVSNIYYEFNKKSINQTKLQKKITEIETNHYKLKDYITNNYDALVDNIQAEIRMINKKLEAVPESDSNFESKMKKFEAEKRPFEKALEELDYLSNFYNH